MRVHLAATLLALLVNYLALSEGALSPPLNLSVELLDFNALARWLPGPGNPEGTRYSLEFIDIEHLSLKTCFASRTCNCYDRPIRGLKNADFILGQLPGPVSLSPWNQTRNCTNITSTQCYLSLNQNILSEYFIRVRAKSEEEQSEWTCLPRSIQPYKYTLLSAPNMSVLSERHSIQIFLSHPVQSLMEVRMRFSVNLFQMINNSAEKHIAQNITPKSSSFVNLPSGIYFINASAFLTTERRKNNNATKCVFLHHDHKEGKLLVIILGVPLLLTVPAMVALTIIIYCYVKPQRISNKPKALIITVTGMSPTFNFEEHQAFPLSRIFIDEGTPLKNETAKTSFQRKGIHQRTGEKIKEILLSDNEGYADQEQCTESDYYSTAAKMEESETENFRTSCYFEQTDSSESLGSDDVYESNYEPRPDPRYMLNLFTHKVKQ